MMGEYIIYYKGKVVGGVYDDRFLLKVTKSSKELLKDAPLELPYEGGHEMFLVDIDDKELLERVIPLIYNDLPVKMRKKSK